MDWFLYDRILRHERVNIHTFEISSKYTYEVYLKFEICLKADIFDVFSEIPHCTKKERFLLMISSVNVTKFAVFYGFGHIY